MWKRLRFLVILFFFSLSVTAACSSPTVNTPTDNPSPITQAPDGVQRLRIWWAQGFIPEENAVIAKLFDDWKKQSGVEVDLTLMSDANIFGEVQKALNQGNPPDILFSFSGDFNLYPRLAFDGQLADVTEIVEPMADAYIPLAIAAVQYQNKKANKRSFYGIPIAQQELHTNFWRDLLTEAELKPEEVPTDWDKFWQFWRQAHDKLRQKGKDKLYGIGMTVSANGTDAFWQFEYILEAYNVRAVDDQGNLIIDQPQAREGIIKTINHLADLYAKRYIPEDSPNWGDANNNIGFLNRQLVMTMNPTLSIPLSQKQPDNIYNKNPRDRYFNKIATTRFPNKPNGAPMTYLTSIRQVVMFASSKQQEVGKSLLRYLIEPANLDKFLKDANKGRFFPVLKSQLGELFWNDPVDPHLSAAAEQYRQPARLIPIAANPAYSQVPSQQIWGKALVSVLKGEASPEQAADQAIAKIKEVFTQWK